MKLEKEINIFNVYNSHGLSTLDLERVFTEEEIDIIRKMYSKRVKLTLEVEEPILDDEERKYLSGVIRPFKNKINCIIKRKSEFENKKEYIVIYLNTNDHFSLPYFGENTMYKGMKLDKEYTLDDLNL